MTAKVRHCSRCSNVLEPRQLERVSTGDEGLKLQVTGFPALQCAKGHAAPVHRDFMLWLMRELRAKCAAAIPGGDAKGMLFKKFFCACGRELPQKAEHTGKFAFELAYPESPAFRAEFELPVFKCSGCGKEQARSARDVAGRTPETIAALNDAAGFPHSG